MIRNDEFINSHYEMAKELLMTLGKIPAPSHQEDKRAQFCLKWFHEHQGGNAYIDKAKNVICQVRGKSNRMVIVMAHMDVVFDDLTELPMKLDGNILRAPGIGDDTANLVNMLMGYLYIKENNITPEYTILFVCNACEEGLGNLDGSKQIMEDYKDSMHVFYSFDGNYPHCTNRAVGSYRYRITIKTQGGHSYGNFGNKNAIVEMSKLIQELDNIELPEGEKTTYNIGVIEGGSTVNSIAQKCSILYEFRSPNIENLNYMEKKLNMIIKFYKDKGINISIEVLGIRPGSKLDNLDTLDQWTRVNTKIIEKYCGNSYTGAGSTDANIPLSLGLLANTIGTVFGQGAHTREEWVDLESLETGMNIVIDILKLYM